MKQVMLNVRTGATAFILLLSVLVSCTKSDKPTAEAGSPIAVTGEWKISDFTVVNNSTGSPRNGDELATLNYGSFSVQQDGHWSAPGAKGGTWTVDGNTLFINFENGARIALTVYKADSILIMEQLFEQRDQFAGGAIHYTFLKQ